MLYNIIIKQMQTKANSYQRYGNFIINKSQPLGSGNFGHVWKGYLIKSDKSLEPVAIKQSHNQTQNIKQIQALQILNHPNIIQYRDYRISGNSVFMVMQLCQNGTLDDLLYSMQTHNIDRILSIYSQIIEGIKFMYEKKILHRDIKPSNILVNKKGIIKIADFGTSKMNRSSQIKLKTLVGTPLFFSPQLFEMSFGEEDTYTQKSQIWALGLILYYMFNFEYNTSRPAQRMKQSLPWSGRNTLQIFKNIKNEPLVFKKQDRIPNDIKQIIKKMLKINAEERMSFEELFNIEIFKKREYKIQQAEIQQQIEQKTININQTKRQTIDWQLLDILQRKDQEFTENEQRQQLRQFYELLIQQLSQVYQQKYKQLMFELQFMYYQLTNDLSEKNLILEKYKQKQDIFKQISSKCQNQAGVNKFSSNPSLVMANKSNIIEESRFLNLLVYPHEKLVAQAKIYLKDNLPKIYNNKGSKFLQGEIKKLINFIYDLFTLITFEKSWQIKRKSKASIIQYKKLRKLVKLQTILARILKAAECVKI